MAPEGPVHETEPVAQPAAHPAAGEPELSRAPFSELHVSGLRRTRAAVEHRGVRGGVHLGGRGDRHNEDAAATPTNEADAFTVQALAELGQALPRT